MVQKDTRDWITHMEKLGQLKHIKGADWNLELTATGAMSLYAILFDEIKGYPKNYRVLTGMTKTVDCAIKCKKTFLSFSH